ncbi:hypothetical protein B0T22DRAFT_367887 [Podospora appendiculata]|uniref:MARVEL domain-containing protein n=1 Tax=Podospora appendiculata TaxID=314037 RepID=A0AAE0XGK3_9PEZI|nr:hypothetical protein B0T22DRAFT_367887 [Podospora appendiculata]
MNTAKNTAGQLVHRSMLGINNFIILSSSAIITGILSYFIHRYRGRGTHLIYQEVIAVVTLFLYLFAVFLPILKSYRGYLLPLNLALSYLWLTSLIFSSQDYSGRRCYYNSPPLVNHCGLKHTVQAFNIIGFSMLFLNTIIEALMWASHRGTKLFGNGVATEKNAPLNSTTGAGVPRTIDGNGVGRSAV